MASTCRVGPLPTGGNGCPSSCRGGRRSSRSRPAVRGSAPPPSRTCCATSARASSIGLVLRTFDGTSATGRSSWSQPPRGWSSSTRRTWCNRPLAATESLAPSTRTPAAGAGVAVPGERQHATRRGVGVAGADLGPGTERDAAHRLALEPQDAPCRPGPWRQVPGLDDLATLDDEDTVGAPPVAHRGAQPLEVRLPHRLVLTGVEEHRRRDEGHGLLLGGPLVWPDPVEARTQERLEADEGHPLVGRSLHRRFGHGRRVLRRRASGARAGPPCQQPVAQHPRRHAVVAVVGGDLVEQRGGVGQPLGVAGRHELVVDDDRVGGVGDGRLPRGHVERLELLDRVRALRDPDGGAHDGVQVDEDAVAQQLVDLVLADPVPGGQAQERGGLVGGVVVDVQVGPALPARR